MQTKLSNTERKFLGLIYRKPRLAEYIIRKLKLTDNLLFELSNGTLKDLTYYNVHPDDYMQSVYSVNLAGKETYESYKREKLQYRLSLALSTLALIVSILALAHSIVTQ